MEAYKICALFEDALIEADVFRIGTIAMLALANTAILRRPRDEHR